MATIPTNLVGILLLFVMVFTKIVISASYVTNRLIMNTNKSTVVQDKQVHYVKPALTLSLLNVTSRKFWFWQVFHTYLCANSLSTKAT